MRPLATMLLNGFRRHDESGQILSTGVVNGFSLETSMPGLKP